MGIYLFTQGFLLTRLILKHESECAVPPIPPSGLGWVPSVREGCWHPKSFNKAVIVLVDALRYDFTVPFVGEDATDRPHHFHNALPVFYETAVRQPVNSFLRPFIADPPTVTLQRLKGLTTGTLPTFVEAGSNFAGTAIDEDNLIGQLRRAGRRIVHLGDDTWHSLFPGHFEPNLTKAYDSFNVWDLHSVDDGVNEHLFPLLDSSNASKWDVIIAHYLGVDHAGHRYGPDHAAMAAKLRQMDQVFRRVIDALDSDTLLVVMGDHGMDSKGDHGGESDDEIEAALWMYSKDPFFGRISPEHVAPPATAKERPVAQIDLVPTLSLLLGLPIPFNNLGAPIEEAFVGTQGRDLLNLATVTRLAAAQINRYQYEYAAVRKLDQADISGPLALWKEAIDMWDRVVQSKRVTSEQWKEAYSAFLKYQKANLNVCRSLWARFDIPSMIYGIVTLTAALAVLVAYARCIEGDVTDLTPILLRRGIGASVIGALLGALSGVSIPFVAAIASCMGLSSAFWYARRRLKSALPDSLWSKTSIIFTLALSAGFASNSFTIWEDEILLFFLGSFGVLLMAFSLRHHDYHARIRSCYQSAVFMILTRLASLSRLCREDQMPQCRSTYYASTSSSTSSAWQLSIPVLVAMLLPEVVKSFYNSTNSYQGSAAMWIRVAFRAGLVFSSAFWVLDAADDGDWSTIDKGLLKTVRILIAQFVLALALAAGYSTFAWASPFLGIRNVAKSTIGDTKPASTTVPSENPTSDDGPVVSEGASSFITILGYSNVHGSRYFLLVTIWLMVIILVQKPMGGGAIGVLGWQILSLLEIIYENSLSNTAVGPVVLGLLGSFHFFKTGHQAALSSIQWETAFIPLRAVRHPWSPLLVVLNTFGAQILCAVAVPAVVLWKQPPRKKELLSDVAKAMTTHLLFYAVISLATTVWAGWLRRHLMLMRVFSPRFMLGATVLLVVDLVGILVAVGGTRWSFLSVAKVFGWQ